MNQLRGHPMTVMVRWYDTASPAVDGDGVPTYFQQVLEGDRGDRELWERVAAEVLNPSGDWVEAPRIIGVLRHRGRYWAYALRTDLKDSHGRGGRQVFVIASASEATSLSTEVVFREFTSLLETVVNSRSSNAATGNPAAPDVKSADPARLRESLPRLVQIANLLAPDEHGRWAHGDAAPDVSRYRIRSSANEAPKPFRWESEQPEHARAGIGAVSRTTGAVLAARLGIQSPPRPALYAGVLGIVVLTSITTFAITRVKAVGLDTRTRAYAIVLWTWSEEETTDKSTQGSNGRTVQPLSKDAAEGPDGRADSSENDTKQREEQGRRQR